MNIIDSYFKKPVLVDYFVGIVTANGFNFLMKKGIVLLPLTNTYESITTDIANVGLTSTGFILTLLTVLITFKSSSRITKKNIDKAKSVFEVFFVSGLYFETVRHLKNCIKSLIFISILGFSLKLLLNPELKHLLYFYNIIGLIVLVMTLWRCLLILTKILEMQEKE